MGHYCLEPDTVVNEVVLHKMVNVVKESRTVEQQVIDSQKDCIKLDEYSDKKVCDDSYQPMQVDLKIFHASGELH
ncbi:hypothetical protein Tco_1470265 [Tanacetum coccineum]